MNANKETYEPICEYVRDTNDQIKNNNTVSPELKVAMGEFREKSHDLHQNFSNANLERSIVEIEQAADSALRVASASSAPENLTAQIRNAHNKMSDFKQEVLKN